MNRRISYRLNKQSQLVDVSVADSPAAIEQALGREGVELGVHAEAERPLADYLRGGLSLEPFLKHGDTHDLLAAVGGRDADGRLCQTFLTPRTAAGPNLRFLLTGANERFVTLERATLRVHETPQLAKRLIYAASDYDTLLGAMRRQIQQKNRPQLLRIYRARDVSPWAEIALGGALLIADYEGERDDVLFRSERTARALEAAGAQALDRASLDSAIAELRTFAPLTGPDPDDSREEVRLVFSLAWSRLLPMLEELTRRSGGIYPVQVAVAGSWHIAALMVMRLMSFEGERDRSLIARETRDLLEMLALFRAGVLEVRPLHGKIDSRLDELFSDPLTERLV